MNNATLFEKFSVLGSKSGGYVNGARIFFRRIVILTYILGGRVIARDAIRALFFFTLLEKKSMDIVVLKLKLVFLFF